MEVFLVTAGNCGACKGIKASGGFTEIIAIVKSKGGRPHEVYTDTMKEPFSSAGVNGENFRNMDKFANKLFRNWFPTFVAMSREVFDEIERGTLTDPAEVAKLINVFNGVYTPTTESFSLKDRNMGISPKIFSQWYDIVRANSSNQVRAPAIAAPMAAHTAPPMAAPIPIPRTQFPLLNSPNVVKIPSNQPAVGDIGDIGFATCPQSFDFYLSKKHGR